MRKRPIWASKKTSDAAVTLLINEIFFSIQGESTFAGLPCAFIRLAGCNLRCTYCDTAYAYDSGNAMTIPEILSKIKTFNARWVEVTGGEPLIQEGTPELIRSLLKNGYRVLLETNGSLDIAGADPACTRIVDLKCPSSGENGRIFWPNLDRMTPNDQIKFVIQDRGDYAFAQKTLPKIPSCIPSGQILFSPVSGVLPPRDLAEWILADGLRVRLHLQLHRILWPDTPRGK